jgi:hypothetical protein
LTKSPRVFKKWKFKEKSRYFTILIPSPSQNSKSFANLISKAKLLFQMSSSSKNIKSDLSLLTEKILFT